MIKSTGIQNPTLPRKNAERWGTRVVNSGSSPVLGNLWLRSGPSVRRLTSHEPYGEYLAAVVMVPARLMRVCIGGLDRIGQIILPRMEGLYASAGGDGAKKTHTFT